MSFVLQRLIKLNDMILKLCKGVAIVLIAVMTVLVLVQVFFRYVLNDSFTWTEELARFMMVWMTFMTAPIAYRMGSNVSLDLVYKLFKGRLHFLLKIILHLAALTTLYLLFDKSLGLVERGEHSTATSMPIPMSYIYISLPIGLGLTALVNIEFVLDALIHLINNDPESKESHLELSGE